ncbi:pyrethroid hydrolase Ces2e-like [Babylonia areolata]|uniref:pyrethroid hydrolase Ces2e-like n=1 Tax=Babylonia areolata TaxID=304850 RepID=UPI003FD189F4
MRSMVVILVLLLSLLMNDLRGVSGSQPVVTVGGSTLFGTSLQVGNKSVNRYAGLPYAQPPVGNLRFRKPVAASLPDVLNATTFGSACPGLINIQPIDEDCLFLDLYVPASSRPVQAGAPETGVPVMVWLHGGGFVFGSGSQYDGSLLAAEGNVIVVTVNYRVGALGFLSTGDNSSVGNYGLWDQWLALKWVQQNIGHFGGDADRVTIFGESAGAASVSYHMTSPHSKPYFHRAIMHSGSRLCPWAMDAIGLSHAQTLGIMRGCNTTGSTSSLVSCLRGKDWDSLKPAIGAHTWAPVVDNDFVLPFNLSAIFDGPYIIGFNNREGGLLFAPKKQLDPMINMRHKHVSYIHSTIRFLYPALAAAAPELEKTRAAEIVDCVYRREGSTDSKATDEELEAFEGDVDVVLGTVQFLRSEQTERPRYEYYFDHYPDNIKDGHKGMDHAMDIEYAFGFASGLRGPYSVFFNRTVSDRDRLLAKRYRTLLTNFAHSGNPNNPTELPGWPQWPMFTSEIQNYFNLTIPPSVGVQVLKDLRTVWFKTVPGVLQARGPLGLNATRWSHCADLKTSQSPVLSASVFVIVGTVFWCVLVMLL